ncbi:hypothetical protein CHS0354_028298 [Potamilus streckersoni]|uniref:IRF tryptophan pentad repeat domain-containing protein n=1 Tax=Potamilus streckersoni TaxID=2493646 RepID=A0AAE0VJ36_9BIVA|nr:hypothetical protein CHS0354_028298 [Potamilus streckersoni]
MTKSKRLAVKEKMEKLVRKPIRPLERQRMRPWLIELLDKDTMSQLSWLNKREKMFRITWRHAARQGWDMAKDACLFEKWARHTGKFYDGDKPDAKRWKANFRCALNSLPDVVEEKSKGMRKGQNAFKVYRFLDDRRVKSKKRSKAGYSVDSDDASCAESPATNPRMDTDLDSEGSENCCSPTRDDVTSSDCESSASEATSPLPVFSKICKFEEASESRHDFVWPNESVPNSCSMSSSDDESSSTTSSVPTDDEVVQMLLEDDPVYPSSVIWNTPILFTPEEFLENEGCNEVVNYVVLDGSSSYPDRNANVIVQPSQDVQDYNFTSLSML